MTDMLPIASRIALEAMERAHRAEPRVAPAHPVRRRTAAALHALAHRIDVPRPVRSG
jgi:hypothetical protein